MARSSVGALHPPLVNDRRSSRTPEIECEFPIPAELFLWYVAEPCKEIRVFCDKNCCKIKAKYVGLDTLEDVHGHLVWGPGTR